MWFTAKPLADGLPFPPETPVPTRLRCLPSNSCEGLGFDACAEANYHYQVAIEVHRIATGLVPQLPKNAFLNKRKMRQHHVA